MLPCNVILQQREDGRTEISAVDPVASMQAIDNEELARTAGDVGSMLRQVIEELALLQREPSILDHSVPAPLSAWTYAIGDWSSSGPWAEAAKLT